MVRLFCVVPCPTGIPCPLNVAVCCCRLHCIPFGIGEQFTVFGCVDLYRLHCCPFARLGVVLWCSFLGCLPLGLIPYIKNANTKNNPNPKKLNHHQKTPKRPPILPACILPAHFRIFDGCQKMLLTVFVNNQKVYIRQSVSELSDFIYDKAYPNYRSSELF